MSLTKISRNQYTIIDPFNWTPPCTLEIKFSTCDGGRGGDYWNNPTLLGIERTGVDGDWAIAVINGYLYIWSGDGHYSHYSGKLVNDGQPHTVRICVDVQSKATIYVDGVYASKISWNKPYGTSYLGYNGVHGSALIQAPTTWYYIKFVNQYITDPRIDKSDCSAHYTWDSDGNMIKNGVAIKKLGWGKYDDITLDLTSHPSYNHNLDLYGKKK